MAFFLDYHLSRVWFFCHCLLLMIFVTDLCSAGSYMTETGCQQCGENTFSTAGASSCSSCPKDMVSAAGSTSEDNCSYGKKSAIFYYNHTVMRRKQLNSDSLNSILAA